MLLISLIFLRYFVTHTHKYAYVRMKRRPVIRKSYQWPKFAPDRREPTLPRLSRTEVTLNAEQ